MDGHLKACWRCAEMAFLPIPQRCKPTGTTPNKTIPWDTALRLGGSALPFGHAWLPKQTPNNPDYIGEAG